MISIALFTNMDFNQFASFIYYRFPILFTSAIHKALMNFDVIDIDRTRPHLLCHERVVKLVAWCCSCFMLTFDTNITLIHRQCTMKFEIDKIDNFKGIDNYFLGCHYSQNRMPLMYQIFMIFVNFHLDLSFLK